jgi:peptide/nickel transport system permease protein
VRSYIGRRLASAIPVVLVVAVVGFVLFRLTPGDPAALLAGDNATREQIERTRQYLGLDQPIHVQFGRYLNRLAHADFGQSIFLGRPVTTAILERLEPTISLAIAAEIFAIALAVPLGLLAALRANTWLDQAAMALALAGLSIPAFWLGLLLVFSFGVKLGWLPVGEFRPLADGLGPFLRHMILPAVSLGLIQMALTARMVRSSMLEVLREDYIRTAHAGHRPAAIVVLTPFATPDPDGDGGARLRRARSRRWSWKRSRCRAGAPDAPLCSIATTPDQAVLMFVAMIHRHEHGQTSRMPGPDPASRPLLS